MSGNWRGRGRGGSDRGGSGRGGSGRGDHASSSRGRGDYSPGRGRGYGSPGGGRGDYSSPGRGRGRGRGGGSGQFSAPAQPLPREVAANVDLSIQALENSMCQSGTASADKSKESSSCPRRPAYGTEGEHISVLANYMQLSMQQPSRPKGKTAGPQSPVVLYSYDISMSPDAVGRKRVQVMRLWLDQYLAEIDKTTKSPIAIATDFRTRLIANRAIDLAAYTRQVRYRLETEQQPRENAAEYTVALDAVASLRLSCADLFGYLTDSKAFDSVNPQEYTQAFNIILNHFAYNSPDNRVIIGGRRVFDISAAGSQAYSRPLSGGLEALRGFFSSVRLATGRLLVNVNVTNAAFYSSVRLSELMDTFALYKTSRSGGSTTQWTRSLLIDLEKFLRRVRVQPMYGDQCHPRRIIGLANPKTAAKSEHPLKIEAFGAGPQHVQFWMNTDPSSPGAGHYVSVYDHFNETVFSPGQTLEPQYPLVNVGSVDRPTFLPADMCRVLPGQVVPFKLDDQQTTDMISFAVRPPAKNALDIFNHAPKVLLGGVEISGQAEALAQFGLEIDRHLVSVPARILQPPAIAYRSAVKTVPQSSASWNLWGVQFATAGQLGTRWECFALTEAWAQCSGAVRAAVQRFRATLQTHGMEAGQAQAVSGGVESVLRGKLPGMASRGVKLLVVVLPSTSAAVYGRVKALCDVQHGVSTVCVVGKSFVKAGNGQYLSNVALKVNLKLGGCNQRLGEGGGDGATRSGSAGSGRAGSGSAGSGSAGSGSAGSGSAGSGTGRAGSVRPAELSPTTMVVGIDVTHPSPSSRSTAPSIAAMVASTEPTLSQWPAELRLQRYARDEMVTALEAMLAAHLQRWRARHGGSLPESVLVYRDGVSEGQYQQVLDKEIPQLRRAFALYDKAPALTVVVVGKRHHTRFFPSPEGGHADKNGNALPGTVVDRGVTSAARWDFFLQSHRAVQGTARAAHYVVLCDEVFRGCGELAGQMKTLGLQAASSQAALSGPADALERVTLALCYIFGRATGSVSIATPAYYADLACDRARCYLKDVYEAEPSDGGSARGTDTAEDEAERARQQQRIQVHERLRDSMFYI